MRPRSDGHKRTAENKMNSADKIKTEQIRKAKRKVAVRQEESEV